MARRDIFRNIKETVGEQRESRVSPNYAERGASRNMLSSINELAEKAAKAEQLLAGEVIVEIDPELIDGSFVSDRLAADDDDFADLLNAIRENGQDTPALLRPNPKKKDRFQVVFGHQRVRAAQILKRKVKAVVREVTDREHVIKQGQENSARKNLSFIERASFAQQLLDLGHDRGTIQEALAIDAAMLTRMLSVTSRVPIEAIRTIGPAKGIGRDRWLELAQAIETPDAPAAVDVLFASPAFIAAGSDGRFELLLRQLKGLLRPRRQSANNPSKTKWQPEDKALSAVLTDSGKAFAVSFKSKDASRFGRYLASNLDRLYGEFKQSDNEER